MEASRNFLEVTLKEGATAEAHIALMNYSRKDEPSAEQKAMAAKFQEFGKALEAFSDAQTAYGKDAAEAFEKLKPQADAVLQPIAERHKPLLGEAFDKLAALVKDFFLSMLSS